MPSIVAAAGGALTWWDASTAAFDFSGLGWGLQLQESAQINPGVFVFCALLYLQLPLTFEIAAAIGTPAHTRCEAECEAIRNPQRTSLARIPPTRDLALMS